MGTFSKLKKALRTHLIFNSLDLNYQFKLYLNNFKKKNKTGTTIIKRHF